MVLHWFHERHVQVNGVDCEGIAGTRVGGKRFT